MSYLINDAVTRSRQLINDLDLPYRHSDEKLLGYFNDALLRTQSLRADLFIGDLQQKTFYTILDLGVEFPIDAGYFTAIVDFMVSAVEMENDEFSTDGRGMSLYSRYVTKLTGKFA